MHRLLVLGLAALGLVAAAPKGVDWTKHVVATPAGAYVMGNPDAKVKLVEYLSYTCPHCAHFTGEAAAPLKARFVAKGGTSVELRHAVRDRFDFAAALLARCGGAKSFFRNSEAILAHQMQWMEAGARFEAEKGASLAELSPSEALKAYARGAGLADLMKTFGYSDAQLDQCLADEGQQKQVIGMAREAWTVEHIPGTPSFSINGRRVDGATSWAALEQALRTALN